MEEEQQRIERVQKKFAAWHRLREEQGMRFNVSLFERQSFHNPNIAETLMGWVGVDPKGTNFPQNPMIQALVGEKSSNYDEVRKLISSFDYERVGEAQRKEWEQQKLPQKGRMKR